MDSGLEFTCIPEAVKLAIQRLWQDKGVLHAFEERHRFQVIDSAA